MRPGVGSALVVWVTVCVAMLVQSMLPSVAAAERILDFDTVVELHEDGAFTVVERIVYDFEAAQKHGIYREIPVHYGRGAAADYRIELNVESVTDSQAHARPFVVSGRGERRLIRIGSAGEFVTGRQEYRIRYRVRRGILWLEEHDEFYWNATGTEWEVPIDRARVELKLPSDFGADVRMLCFTGPRGSVDNACTTRASAGAVVAEAHRGFGAREGLTLVVALPKGRLLEPSASEKRIDRLGDFVSSAYLLPLAVLLGCLFAWRSWGRDPRGIVAIPVRYEPPENMSPAEMGTVLDESVDMQDVTATILDLAVRGHLRIEEITTRRFIFFSNRDYRLHLISPGTRELLSHEHRVIDGLFEGAQVRDVSDLKEKFYENLPGIKSAIYREVSREGRWFPSAPDKVRRRYLILSLVLGGIGVVVAHVLVHEPLLVAVVLSTIIAVAFSRVMPRRTRKGRRALQHILGFKEFVERVEKDRLERLGQLEIDQFEKWLPYAFVLGVADSWAEAFADLYTESPEWYVSNDDRPFESRRFVTHVGRSMDTVGHVMRSKPSGGSGSSGFGGGGSSGGGFGGGGGGSW